MHWINTQQCSFTFTFTTYMGETSRILNWRFKLTGSTHKHFRWFLTNKSNQIIKTPLKYQHPWTIIGSIIAGQCSEFGMNLRPVFQDGDGGGGAERQREGDSSDSRTRGETDLCGARWVTFDPQLNAYITFLSLTWRSWWKFSSFHYSGAELWCHLSLYISNSVQAQIHTEEMQL